MSMPCVDFFFFQAEDGIRDKLVTGVQTCALPISHLDRSLVVAVARGRCWARGLCRGDYKDTAQIACKFDLSEAYVRRILRLAYLAPDVVLAIAEGRHPPTLVLQRLLAPIPLAWAEQRQTLGFTI